MSPPARSRPQRQSHSVLETACVLLILIAAIALVAWLILHAGGGVINQG
jgi:hypothetical protein